MYDETTFQQLQARWPETDDYLERVSQLRQDQLTARELWEADRHIPDFLERLAIDWADLTGPVTMWEIAVFLHQNGTWVPEPWTQMLPALQQSFLTEVLTDADQVELWQERFRTGEPHLREMVEQMLEQGALSSPLQEPEEQVLRRSEPFVRAAQTLIMERVGQAVGLPMADAPVTCAWQMVAVLRLIRFCRQEDPRNSELLQDSLRQLVSSSSYQALQAPATPSPR